MNPMLQAALGAVLRWALAIGAGYLIKAGIWTSSDAETYVTAAALAILALGWSLYQKYSTRSVLLTALASGPISEFNAKEKAKVMAPPVTTPVNVVPKIDG